MKKSVLFHYPVLNMGGAEKSTLRMLRALCDRGWQITLVLTTGGGALESEIDPRVKVVRLRPRMYGQHFVEARGLSKRLLAIPDLLGYGVMRVVGVVRMIPFLFRRYDAGVLLAISLPTTFVRSFVRCKVRAHWIRSDFRGYFPARDASIRHIRANEKYFDYYICVSEFSRQSLVQAIPEIAEKATVVYNIIDAQAMRIAAGRDPNPFPATSSAKVTLLSVCRLKDKSKGLFRMVRLCKRLVEDGRDFVWYVIGDGPDRVSFQAAIDDARLQNHMVLLGFMRNPFPAYREADLVAVLSYYEGLCGVVNEAKVMGCAVIATKVSGINEQLNDQVNGFIVENDEDVIYQTLTSVLSSKALLKKTRNFDYPSEILDDKRKIEKIEHLFLKGMKNDG
jgi:glycosyltransferase involved in cell wall biosynthesis